MNQKISCLELDFQGYVRCHGCDIGLYWSDDHGPIFKRLLKVSEQSARLMIIEAMAGIDVDDCEGGRHNIDYMVKIYSICPYGIEKNNYKFVPQNKNFVLFRHDFSTDLYYGIYRHDLSTYLISVEANRLEKFLDSPQGLSFKTPLLELAVRGKFKSHEVT